MGLVQRSSATATETMPIDNHAVSTGVISLLPHLHPIHLATNLGIPQLSGTDKFLHIFEIPVTIEIDEDVIVVTDYIVHMYGVGNDEQEAIEDYKISIKAYLEELQEDEDRLGSNLKKHLYYLRDKSKYFE